MRFGSPYQQIVTKSADYTAVSGPSSNDDLVVMDASAAPRTVTLPSFVGVQADPVQGIGRVRVMKAITDTSGNPVNVVVAGGGSVFGQSILLQAGQSADFYADGLGNWWNFSPIQNSFECQIPISSADILGLNATPKTLIPAPGANKVIVVEHILLKMITTATAYANGGALEFRYTNAAGAKVTADIAAAVVTAGAGTSYTGVAGVTTSLTMVANAPIVVDNATAAFITGTGTAVATVRVRIVTP